MFLHSNDLPPEGDLTLMFDTDMFLQTEGPEHTSEPTKGSCFRDVVPLMFLTTTFEMVSFEGLARHLLRSFCA
jgi:hypothetical protein